MKHPLVALAVLSALLWGARITLSGENASAEHAPRYVRLADSLRTDEPVIAGLGLRRPGDEGALLYVRSRGVWRCLSAWGAPCDAQRVEGLVRGLLAARGVVRAEEDGEKDLFGLSGPDALEITLQGKEVLARAAGDPVLDVVFGASSRVAGGGVTATTGAFARVAGRPQVLELDLDPRAALAEPAPGLPPLLDAHLVPGDFPGPGRRVERLLLDRGDGEPLELVRRPHQARAPERGVSAADTLDWEWVLNAGGRAEVIPPLRGEAYVTWLPRAPYVGLADPEGGAQSDEPLGLAQPQARITLVDDLDTRLELVVGAPRPDGGVWVRVPTVPLIAALDAARARLLLPDAAELSDDRLRNRWDEALRAALAATNR